MASAFPPHWGLTFTKAIHSKAEGSTDPTNNPQPAGTVVCVTGAGRAKGLGYHVALAYARAGAAGIAISARTASDLDQLTAEIHTINPKTQVLSQLCDVTKDADVDRLAAAVKSTFSRLDILVANAGVSSKYLADGTIPKSVVYDDDYARIIDINFIGTARTVQKFVPLLIASGGLKTIIVQTSLSMHLADSQVSSLAYNTSKRALTHMVEHLAADHEKDGLLAYACHPGAILTPMTLGNSLEKGDLWDQILNDDVNLCGGFFTWLTTEKRPWLSGRYLACTWDVDELLQRKEEIVAGDKLKLRMVT